MPADVRRSGRPKVSPSHARDGPAPGLRRESARTQWRVVSAARRAAGPIRMPCNRERPPPARRGWARGRCLPLRATRKRHVPVRSRRVLRGVELRLEILYSALDLTVRQVARRAITTDRESTDDGAGIVFHQAEAQIDIEPGAVPVDGTRRQHAIRKLGPSGFEAPVERIPMRASKTFRNDQIETPSLDFRRCVAEDQLGTSVP